MTRFVFVDETSTNLTYCRRYGRAPTGQRLGQAVPLHGGPNGTLIATLTPEGLGALLTVEGTVNGDVFGRGYLSWSWSKAGAAEAAVETNSRPVARSESR
ncbi:transposase [Hymenobacter siberiensis]|uniref:transposase n=1 Tax=Hymenobacter siberiensis TaxID=2848396 RepID=UPI001D031730|nr:transposase [Hymenobacter siberiensis]